MILTNKEGRPHFNEFIYSAFRQAASNRSIEYLSVSFKKRTV